MVSFRVWFRRYYKPHSSYTSLGQLGSEEILAVNAVNKPFRKSWTWHTKLWLSSIMTQIFAISCKYPRLPNTEEMQSYLIVRIFSQVFLKLSKDSVCFSSLTLAMVAVIALVLITKIGITTGEPQKTMYFTRFQGEREKKKISVVVVMKVLSTVISPDTLIPSCKHKNSDYSAVASPLIHRFASRWSLDSSLASLKLIIVLGWTACVMILIFTGKALVPSLADVEIYEFSLSRALRASQVRVSWSLPKFPFVSMF